MGIEDDFYATINFKSGEEIFAKVAALRDFGTYPIFLANETTFSLKVALSMKTSFATMLALYEVM